VTVSIVVSAPQEAVFDYLQDIANHAEFTDHFLVDWNLTRIDSVGTGAGARFRAKAFGNRFSWAEVALAEVERPWRIVEIGRTGKFLRIRTQGVYELTPASGGATRVRYSFQTAPATLSDRIMESLGGRQWVRRNNRRAMRRLRGILEGEAQPGRRPTVAGG
jgi:hypothetical protein